MNASQLVLLFDVLQVLGVIVIVLVGWTAIEMMVAKDWRDRWVLIGSAVISITAWVLALAFAKWMVTK